jgi:hypothetical protein
VVLITLFVTLYLLVHSIILLENVSCFIVEVYIEKGSPAFI